MTQYCPGIGVPGVAAPFPVIHTLLSIPFALLHQVPRLASMSPLTVYQSNLLDMAQAIIRLWSWDPVAPQGAAVPASAAAASSSRNSAFQNLPSVASRTTTFQNILPRVGEARTFPGRLGAPAPSLEDSDAAGDLGDESEGENDESSSSSSGGLGYDSSQHFVGGTTNDMLMACGHLDPGVYVQCMDIRTGLEKSGRCGAANDAAVYIC
jgi:hypothetical protein